MKQQLRRKERREYERAEDLLTTLVTAFFKESIKILTTKLSPEDKAEIKKTGETKTVMVIRKYNRYNSIWQKHVGAYNSEKTRKKEAFLMADAFENAIKVKGHIRIKQSEESWETKIQMLSCVYPIQNKTYLYYLIRDLSVWVTAFWMILGRIIRVNPIQVEQEKKKYGVPKMENPPPPPPLKVTVNEERMKQAI